MFLSGALAPLTSMDAGFMQTQKAIQGGALSMVCAVCGNQMRRWKSQVAKAKWPMTCGKKCRAERMKGTGNPNWVKGAWIENRTGYRLLLVSRLSEADLKLLPNPRPRDYLEHRMVMARHLRRILLPHENVHHINGNKTDNRIENLTLIDWKSHGREHAKIERRMTALMAENQRLKSALARAQETIRRLSGDGRVM